MGHLQPSTPIQVDNTTAVGFANDTMKQKRSRAMDMGFYWVKCRTRQKQFIVYWGAWNLQLGQLPYQASFSCASPTNAPHILTPDN
jgi:hypothetical protein